MVGRSHETGRAGAGAESVCRHNKQNGEGVRERRGKGRKVVGRDGTGGGRQRCMKCLMRSMGSGKMIVAFFSELMLDSVCK